MLVTPLSRILVYKSYISLWVRLSSTTQAILGIGWLFSNIIAEKYEHKVVTLLIYDFHFSISFSNNWVILFIFLFAIILINTQLTWFFNNPSISGCASFVIVIYLVVLINIFELKDTSSGCNPVLERTLRSWTFPPFLFSFFCMRSLSSSCISLFNTLSTYISRLRFPEAKRSSMFQNVSALIKNSKLFRN